MADWINENVELVEDECPVHGENHHPACWPCFLSDALSDPEALEPVYEEAGG